METIVLLGTAGVTVLWSVRSFFFASDRLGMTEDSPFRMVTIGAPSVYFLVLVFTGWRGEAAVRLDLVGMVVIDVVSIVAFGLSFLVQAFAVHRRRYGVLLFAVYHLMALLGVAGVIAIRESPTLLDRFGSLIERAAEIDLFSFEWVGHDVDRQQQDLIAFLNRVLIAVLSYLPIGVLRFLTSVRHRRRMQREIEALRRRVKSLEERERSSDL